MIAVLIGLGIVRGLNTNATAVNTVSTVASHFQTVEDILQGFLADLAHAFGGQFQSVAFAPQIASFLQATLELPEFLKLPASFWPQNLFQRFGVDVLQRALASHIRPAVPAVDRLFATRP